MTKKLPNKLKEAIKTAIIIILIISALVLSYSVWFYGSSFDDVYSSMFGSEEESSAFFEEYEESSYTLSVVAPVRCTVRNSLGIYHSFSGENTSRSNAQSMFEAVSPALAEALSSASPPVQITNKDWENALEMNMMMLDFEGEMPVWAICSALGVLSDEPISISTRYLLIAVNELGRIDLYFKSDARRIYKSETYMDSSYMQTIFSEYHPNGAYFASSSPDTCFAPPEFIASYDEYPVYDLRISNILDDLSGLDASRAIDTILNVFGFNPYTAKSYSEPDNISVYVEDLDTLRIFPDGSMTFYSPEVDELPGVDISYAKKTSLIGEASRICQSLSSYTGDIGTYLIRAYYNEESERFVILLGSEYNAIPIINGKGYYAKFEYKNAMLVSAELSLKSSRVLDVNTSLLPAVQSIAAASNNKELSDFNLYYTESGRANWLYAK